jgi:tetratricopeptide (TPR) repeat protein
MRPIFIQKHGSCAQASGVAYVFTYEINWLRDLPATGENLENQYPTHFTYNFLNDGDPDHGSYIHQGWNIILENGCPSIQTYGSMDANGDPTFWMSGYDKYHDAMQNRIAYHETICLDDPVDGLTNIKQWLYNHNMDNEGFGGLASFATNMQACDIEIIQAPLPEFGKTFLYEYENPDGDGHALTIVGYDDNICCWDINGDGIYTNNIDVDGDNDVDLFDYEKGAFKVANSWGDTWPNRASMGFVYWPYKFLAYSPETGHDEAFIDKVVYIVYPTEEYIPELVLNVKLSHIDRDELRIGIDFAEDANSMPVGYPYEFTYFHSLYFRGGCFPLLGDGNFDPLFIKLDYNYFFANEDVGKLFLNIQQSFTYQGSSGALMEFSLIDNRWSESFELNSEFQNIEIDPGHNTFDIDYDLIPHEVPISENLQFSSNMVSRFSPAVSNNAILTIEEGVKIDMYNSELIIEEGSTLIIEDNAIIHAHRGLSKILVYGEIQVGEGVEFIADEGSKLELVLGGFPVNILDGQFDNCIISGGHPLEITSSIFSNSLIDKTISDLIISQSSFSNSSISAVNPSQIPNIDNFISIIDCYFETAYSGANAMIEIYGYKDFEIVGNSIDNILNPETTFHGISVHYSGNMEPGNVHSIYNNTIFCSFGGCDNDLAGITVYSSIADIQGNVITSNQIGIQSLNYSRVYITGNSAARYEDETQRIKNNNLFQVFASRDAFPLALTWNAIYSNDPSNRFIFHDVILPSPIVNVEHNYWSPAFDPDVNLFPRGHFDYDPIWELNGGQIIPNSAQQLFELGLTQVADSNFTEAKSTFQEVVTTYPEEEPAKNSLKELLYLEPLAENDFEALKSWYLTDSVITSDDQLQKLAESLANVCDEQLENYPEAIEWYENVIENPETLEDSVFAIIDLENLYLQMGIDTNLRSSSYIGRLSQYKPISFKEFKDHKDELISILHKRVPHNTFYPATPSRNDFSANEAGLRNRPNPFTYSSQIFYSLEFDADIHLSIHNNLGQVIKSYTEANKPIGQYIYEFDATDLPGGIYFCSYSIDGIPKGSIKMMVLK